MLGRSPGRTPGVLSNRTAVPVRLLSRASPPPRPSPFEGEGAHRDALGQCASRVRGGGLGGGTSGRSILRSPCGRLLSLSDPHPDAPPQAGEGAPASAARAGR